MAYSIDEHIRNRKEKQGSYSIDEHIRNRRENPENFPTNNPALERNLRNNGSLEEDNEYNSWLDGVGSFSERMASDFESRDGVYQDRESFNTYHDTVGSEVNDLMKQAYRSKNYYTNYGSIYDEVHGSGTSEGILESIAGNIDYLEGIRENLQTEGDYWNQFSDEDAYSYYLENGVIPPELREATLWDATIGSVIRGGVNSAYGQESYKEMTGANNDADKYADILASDDYQFESSNWFLQGISGAAELLGQQAYQLLDPRTLTTAGGAAMLALAAGQAGPQVALPEEIITAPAAFVAGLRAGSVAVNFEIEGGHAYRELIENGVSHETASAIAMGVGGANAALEFLQLDELAKSFKVLKRSGASDTVLDRIINAIADRSVSVAKETAQEVAQEGVTIAGTQLGTKLEQGDFAYDAGEVVGRLGDTALSSALAFGVMNVPGGVYSATTRSQGRTNAVQSAPQPQEPSTPVSRPQGMNIDTNIDATGTDTTRTPVTDLSGGAFTDTTRTTGTEQNDVLSQATQSVADIGRVTNTIAERVMADQEAMDTIEQMSGVSLAGETKAEIRRNVKIALEGIVQRDTATSDNVGTSSSVVQKIDPTPQNTKISTMQRAESVQNTPIPSVSRAESVQNTAMPQNSTPQNNVARLAGAVSVFGQNGQKAARTLYDGESNVEAYYGGFAPYYEAGVTGVDMGKVRTQYDSALTNAQKFAAYSAGQNDAELSLAREKRASGFAKVATDDIGLVYDDYVDSNIDPNTASQVNTVAKMLGTRVQFVDSVRHGTANAQITGSDILIEKGNKNPVTFLLGHEWTHRMQELAPVEYRAFRNFVAEDLKYRTKATATVAKRQGVDLTYEGALDEAVADYAGQMLSDGKVMDDFIQRHRSDKKLLERVRDAIRALVRKLTGAERRQAMTAEGKLNAVLDASVKQVKDLQKKNTTEKSGDVSKSSVAQEGESRDRFSLKMVDGKPVVWVDSNPLTNKELKSHTAVANYIAQHIGDVYTIIESGQKVYFGQDLPSEYTQSKYTTGILHKRSLLRAKNKVTSDLGLLIETATNRRWERTKHTHNKDAKYGMYRYDSTFAFPVKNGKGEVASVKAYDVELLIRNASDGKKYLYDIVGIKENTDTMFNLQQREARLVANKTTPRSSVSDDTVPQDDSDVNTRYSLKGINEDGVEVYETSPQVRALPYKERVAEFRRLMSEEYQGRTARFEKDGQFAYATFESRDLNKSIYGDTRSSEKGKKAKVNLGADGDIFDLVENARYTNSKNEVGKNIPSHKGVTHWDYYVKTVQVDNKVFDVLVDVRVKPNGANVYSIVLKENKKMKASPALSDQSRTLKGWQNNTFNDTTVPQSSDDVNTRYSLKPFAQQVSDTLQGKGARYSGVLVGDTPSIYQDPHIGLKPLPMLMTKKHLKDINHEKSPKNIHWHGLSEPQIARLPELLENPAMILESASRKGDIVVVTGAVDFKNPIIVSIHPDGKGKYNHTTVDSNFLTSMYGKEQFQNFIDNAIKNDMVLYNNKKRTQALFSFAELQLRRALNRDGFFKQRVPQSSDDVNTRYSLKPFAQQVSDTLQGKGARYSGVLVGDTPSIYQDPHIGLKPLPMLMTKKHLKDINHEKSPENDHWHGLPEPQIARLPELLENPAMILESATKKGDIVVVTDEVDGDKMPIIVPIHPDGTGLYNSIKIDSNFITSMYGKKSFKQFVQDAIDSDMVLYNDKKRTQKLFSLAEHQLPRALNRDGFFKQRVPQSSDDVNTRYSLKLNKQEYAQLQSARMKKYTTYGKEMLDKDFIFAHDMWYVINNYGLDDFNVIVRLDPATQSERIKNIQEDLKNGSFRNHKVAIKSVSKHGLPRRHRNRDYVDSGDRRTSSGDATLDDGLSKRATQRGSGDRKGGRNPSGDAEYSLKGGEDVRAIASRLEEIDLLRERVEYWKGQTKRTKRVTTDKKAVKRAVRKLIDTYGADLDAQDFAKLEADLQRLYDDIANSGSDEKSAFSYDDAQRKAASIARVLIENAVETNSELYDTYANLRDYLRTTPLSLGREYHSDITQGYSAFRKQNFGRLKLVNGATNIDKIFDEMSDLWPEFFDSDVHTTPPDQLMRIGEVMDEIYTISERNPYSHHTMEAVSDASAEIMEMFFDLPQTRATFADRQARKLTQAKIDAKNQLDAVQEQNNDRLVALREQNRKNIQQVIERERERRVGEVARLKTRYNEKDAKGREGKKARELRAKIVRHVKPLSRKLLNPTDKNNIPDQYRGIIAKALESIDLSSQYTIDPTTGKRAKNMAGDPVNRTTAFQELRTKYADIARESYMINDPTLIGNEEVPGLFGELIAMGDTKLADMTTDQLETVWQTVRALEHAIRYAGRTLAKGKYERLSVWANDVKEQTNGRRTWKTIGERRVGLDMETPFTFFNHYGEAGREMYRTLRKAQDLETMRKKEIESLAQDIAHSDTARRLEQEYTEFTTERGQTLTLTKAQVMDLYLTAKQEEGLAHLTGGGIVQPEIKIGTNVKVSEGIQATLLTQNDVLEIVGSLSDAERAIADGLQKIVTGPLQQWGNDASMAVYGYRKFTNPNYWRLKVDGSSIPVTIDKGPDMARSLANIGMAQARKKGASGALNISSVFDTYATSASDMLKYSSWLAPMEDVNRLYNFRYKDGENVLHFKELLDRVGGKGASDYWFNLMKDIQSGIGGKSDTITWDMLGKVVGKTKRAMVGMNLSVILQQPTAFFRVAMLLDDTAMAKGVVKGVTDGNGWEKALKYAPIAVRKDMGGFDISSAFSVSNAVFDKRSKFAKVDEFLTSSAAAKMDKITWGKIWNAVEHQVAKDKKGLKVGSEAYYNAVTELFTDVIVQTQVVDGVLQRSQLMRSSNEVTKQATSFMGEPTQNYNMMARAAENVRFAQDAKSRRRAKKLLAKATKGFFISAMVNAVVRSMVRAQRDDEGDEEYWDKVLRYFTGIQGDEENVWEIVSNVVLRGEAVNAVNPINMVPFVNDILSILQGFAVDRMDMAAISDVLEGGQNFIKALGGDSNKTIQYAIKELATSVASLFGLAYGNVLRDGWSIVRNIAFETDNVALQYGMEKMIYDLSASSNSGRYYDILFRALQSNDYDTYRIIRKDMIDTMENMNGDKIENAMQARYNTAREKDPEFRLSQEARDLFGSRDELWSAPPSTPDFSSADLDGTAFAQYETDRTNAYNDILDDMAQSRGWSQIDDQIKDKAMDTAYALAEDMALARASDGQFTVDTGWMLWASGGARYGVDEAEAVLFKTAYDMTSGDKNFAGDTISGSKKSNVLEVVAEQMPWLTSEELDYLEAQYWTPSTWELERLKERGWK